MCVDCGTCSYYTCMVQLYVYGIYHTHMAQIFHCTCMAYTVRVWYVPYMYNTIYACGTEQVGSILRNGMERNVMMD